MLTGMLCYPTVYIPRDRWTSILFSIKSRDPSILAGYQGTWWQNLWGILVPSAGVYVNWDRHRNLPATIGQMAKETAKSIAAQQTPLNSLAHVALGSKIALHFLMAKKGGVSTVAHTVRCTYINNSGEVEMLLEKIFQNAKWLQDVRKTDPLNDLFI